MKNPVQYLVLSIMVAFVIILVVSTQFLSGSFPTAEEWEYMEEEGTADDYGAEPVFNTEAPAFELPIALVSLVVVVGLLSKHKKKRLEWQD